MSLIQLLKFKKWKTRLFKMPHFEIPRFQTGTRVTVASHSGMGVVMTLGISNMDKIYVFETLMAWGIAWYMQFFPKP